MNWLKIFYYLLFTSVSLIGYGQHKFKIKLNINLRPTENFRQNLKNCDVIFYKNDIKFDSIRLKKHTLKKTIKTIGLYKIEFKKNNYVAKHVIINAHSLPKKRGEKYVLKADISLFKRNESQNLDFLKKEPISIAYYNEIREELIWDFEYNRSVVEKIIHAQTKNK